MCSTILVQRLWVLTESIQCLVSWVQVPSRRKDIDKLVTPAPRKKTVIFMDDYTHNDPVKVLVVDDEANIVELLTVSLKFQGFDVRSANSGTDALRVAREFRPDAYILDVMMPGMDGYELLQKLRAEGLEGPVLYLTAKDGVESRIHGLTIGADDYITKPFSLEEVITRLRVVLRRGNVQEDTSEDSSISYADLTLNDDTHEVTKGGELIELSPTEFNLLRFLMLNKEVVLSKAKILDNVWHYDFGGDGNVVESYISYLRRKIDTGDTPLIHTVRGVGYVLRKPRR